MKLSFLAFFCLFVAVRGAVQPVVKTKLGTIQGFYLKTINNRKISGFKGIPFAKPPIGELRFEPPVPLPPWPGVLNASLPSSVCFQYDHFLYKTRFAVFGSEDCLYLNVYTPKVANYEENLLDVIVFIHGGAFMFHSGNALGPEYLLDREVVFVTMNYRLGPLGFLSTEDSVVPGNNGLKDQLLALQWVQENIMSFGGDPNKVTIAGMSAGGASVHYHMLSPKSKGLFKAAIALSGTALCPWAQTENSKEKGHRIALKLGCPIETSRKMVDCLKSRPANQIVELSKLFIPWLYSPFSPFGPVIEPDNPNAFITERPSVIINKGLSANVPFLLSFANAEGLYPGGEILGNDKIAHQLNEQWDLLLPHLLDFNFTISDDRKTEVCQKLKSRFVSSGDVLKNKEGFVQMIGDRLFTLPIIQTAKLHAQHSTSSVHLYQFSYSGKNRLIDFFMSPEIFPGACHGDELPYIIKMPGVPVESEGRNLSKRMIDIWMNFINRKINESWKSVNEGLPMISFLNIQSPEIKDDSYIQKSDFAEESFWSSLKFQEDNGFSSNKHDEL